MQIIDDFLSEKEFEQIVAIGDNLRYYGDFELGDHSQFLGLRTKNCIRELYNTKLPAKLSQITGHNIASFQYHKISKRPKTHSFRHQDGSDIAGVIYLRGAEGSGTVIGEETCEFKINRCVWYNAKVWHMPQGYTADRLTLSFFGLKHANSTRKFNEH